MQRQGTLQLEFPPPSTHPAPNLWPGPALHLSTQHGCPHKPACLWGLPVFIYIPLQTMKPRGSRICTTPAMQLGLRIVYRHKLVREGSSLHKKSHLVSLKHFILARVQSSVSRLPRQADQLVGAGPFPSPGRLTSAQVA